MAVHVKSRYPAKRSREEWHRMFTQDRERGLTGTAIAAKHGLGHSFVYSVLNDPTGDGERRRKDSYRRPCPQCGTLMDGANGRGPHASQLCAACAAQAVHDSRYWTPERIIAAVRAFVAEHGRPPRAEEWQQPDRNGAPGVSFVQREFGSWLNGMRAAGFDVPERGRYVRTSATRELMGAQRSAAGFYWSEVLIVKAIRRWKRAHGTPPSMNDWRFGTDDHPCANTVRKRFGTFNAGIAAAGFTPRKPGEH